MRRKLTWLVGAVVLVVAGVAAVKVFAPETTVIRGSTDGFIATEDNAPPDVPEPDAGSWPEYGFNNQKTRFDPKLRNLGRPGAKLWEYDAGSLVEFPPVIDQGVAVLGTNRSRIVALDMQTGRRIWQARTDGRIATSPAIANGIVYVTTTTGEFIARRLDSGRKVWERNIGSSSESSPTIVGNAIYVANLDGMVIRTNLQGREVWRTPVSGPVKSAIAVSGDRVIAADYGGNVTALSQRDGSIVWSTASPGERFRGSGRFYAGPAVQYGRVYVGNINGRIIALSAADGSLAWLRTAGDWVYSSAAIADKLVFVGSYDHKLYALDAASGDIRWAFDAGERISGSASVIGSIVYVSTLNRDRTTGQTFGLDVTTGRKVWSFPDGRYSPAVAIRSTILIVGRRKIYAFTPR